MSGGVQLQHPVPHGDLMKRRPLFVAEVRVRDPDLIPTAVVKPDLGPVVNRHERQARVAPCLPEIEADAVILPQFQASDTQCLEPLHCTELNTIRYLHALKR